MSKDHFIRFRVAGWEKVHISKNAEKAHMTISEFVRAAAMDQDVTVVEGLDDLIRELRRQGNNLNQGWWTWNRSWRCTKGHGKR